MKGTHDAFDRFTRVSSARTHSPAQVAQIASSIAEFGFVNPVLVDGAGVLVAGHGRVMAAKRLGMASVPAIRLAHLTEPQARALRLADNQIALNSGWDEALLAAEIARIRDEGTVDLEVLGFSPEALEDLLASIGANGDAPAQGDPDAPAAEPPAQPITRPGDLWRLGRHRLLCGDATNRADVLKLLGDAQPHLMVSDPPYGVGYDPAWRNEAGVSVTARTGSVNLREAAERLLAAWEETPPPNANDDPVAQAMAMLRNALSRRGTRATGAPRKPREGTKQEVVLARLRRPEGATVAQIAEATGWAQHTVRGFFAGLKKRQGITVEIAERIRQVGPNKQGAKGSYTVYRVAE